MKPRRDCDKDGFPLDSAHESRRTEIYRGAGHNPAVSGGGHLFHDTDGLCISESNSIGMVTNSGVHRHRDICPVGSTGHRLKKSFRARVNGARGNAKLELEDGAGGPFATGRREKMVVQ